DWSSDVCSSDLRPPSSSRTTRATAIQLDARAAEARVDERWIAVALVVRDEEGGLLAGHRAQQVRHPALEVAVAGRDRAGVHVVAVVRSEPDEVRPGVEGGDDVAAGSRQEVR